MKGGGINTGWRAPPAGHNSCNYSFPGKATSLPLTAPPSQPTKIPHTHHTLDKLPPQLNNSGFFSKYVQPLIIICLNCINNPPRFNRIFL